MPHLIFVVGTLKEGFRNFHINRGQRVPGDFVTALPHPLYIAGDRGLPWLLQRPGQGQPVVGQLFRVDDEALASMDELERIDEPGYYERRRISVLPRDASSGAAAPATTPAPAPAPIEAWVYFGSELGFVGAVLHAGPIGEYLLEHQKLLPRVLW
jgi:gamma-glutamylaminecyclotransferase